MSEHATEKDVLSQIEHIWETQQKNILIAVSAIVVIIGGWYSYNEFIKKPKEEKASELLYRVENYFSIDSSRIVIEGDGLNKGALYIISNYGGTKAANLAHFYAGVSYLKLGQFKKAAEHLKDFSTGAKQIQMIAYGDLADAYSELNQKDDALSYYKKAASVFEVDEANSAEYLFRAALLAESMGKKSDALDLYKSIKEKFPNSTKAQLVDKYIYRLSIEKNNLSID